MNVAKLVFRLLLGRRLPTTSGTIEVPGLRQAVTIRRDRYGIAYVEAQEDDDAWYGLGFCHGQDRAFQLEGLLRIVRGTMAELVGPAVLPIDRLSRRIGFYRAAEAQMDVLDDDIRHTLEAYALGVTHGATLGCRRPAHEYALLRGTPTPYHAADVLGLVKLMGFLLAANWDVELARLKIWREDGPEALAALDPTYPEWQPVTSAPTESAGAAVDGLAKDLALLASTTGVGGGSNNWALAPSRTASGRAIVANDPHLGPSLPATWYLAHVRTPEWGIAGASFVGMPAFPSGHNGVAAWGNTAGMVDDVDLYLHQLGPDRHSVRVGDRFVPCESLVEAIQVKGQEPVREEILLTPLGPIISPALEGDLGAISMQATWLQPRPLRALFALHRVRSFAGFQSEFEQWSGPSMNMVYGDTTGKIGWQLACEAPQRKKGWGTLPLSASDPGVGWEPEPVPFHELPHAVEPAIGFVATANSKPALGDQAPYLGHDWLDGYRLARIVEALQGWEDWDLDSTSGLQLDQLSLAWRELQDAVLAAPAETAEARQALALLQAWNGRVAADSPAAAVYEFFVAEMARRVAASKAPHATAWALGQGFTPLYPSTAFSLRRMGHLVRLVREQSEGWFERSWGQEMADALDSTVRTLRERYGDDPAGWAWGKIRPLTLRHTVGEQAPMDKIFNLGPVAWGGDAHTIGQSTAVPLDPTANPAMIASLRMVVECGQWDEARYILPGGQSGNPLSPHYGDQFPLWLRGEGVPIAWSPEKVAAACREELKLTPRS